MREYTKKPENQSRTLDGNPRASRQVPISEILQAYKNRTLGKRPIQRKSMEGKNLQQSTFETTDQSVVQMRKYVRGIRKGEILNIETLKTIPESTEKIMSREIGLLKRKFAKENFGDYKTVNEWLDGFVGMSTIKYQEGKKHYYSPVGYIVEIEDKQQVIGNYLSDGNTPRMVYISDIGTEVNEDILDRIVLKLDSDTKIGILNRTQKIDFIKEKYNKETIRKVLVEFYNDPTKTKDPLGEGFNPDKLEEALLTSLDKENEYSESLLWATDENVLGAYYNDNDNSPKDNWEKSDGTYKKSAEEINQQLDKDRLFQIDESGVLQGKFESDQYEGINESLNLKNAIQLVEIAKDPLKIKEEEYFIGKSGESIKYTELSAGCMAVTVYFSTGGGAGVHMAMLEQGAGQWTTFYDAISKNIITSIILNCDSWEGDEDWRVREGEDSPKSTAHLVFNEKKEINNLLAEGWKNDKESIKKWFKAKLGVDPLFYGGGTPEYTFP